MRSKLTVMFVVGVLAAMGTAASAYAEDWPTYRHDCARSAATTEALAVPLSPQWTFVPTHPPQPAWPNPAKEKARVRFDEAYHVAVVGDTVYFGSSVDNKVYALDAASGAVRWSTFTGGPVRVAPTVVDGRVYVGSDDGFAYCLNAADGAVLWRARGGYEDDRLLGNGKMISLWPVRTGVLVDDGVAYFGAGVFPHEGIYICAVDAQTGAVLWRNDTTGEKGSWQEFGGVSPQGALLASESVLFVPSARAMPAAYDRKTGDFLYYCSPRGKVGGTWALLTGDQLVAGVESKRVYDPQTGASADAAFAWFPGYHLVVTEDCSYLLTHKDVRALDRRAYDLAKEWRKTVVDEQSALSKEIRALQDKLKTADDAARPGLEDELNVLTERTKALKMQQSKIEEGVHLWQTPVSSVNAMTLAGHTLFLGGENKVEAIDARTGKPVWDAEVSGTACGLAVANGALYVSTDNGSIHSFAVTQQPQPAQVAIPLEETPYAGDDATAICQQAADSIAETTGVTRGYCLVYGCETGRLAYALAKRTDLNIIAVDPDEAKVLAARAALDAAGLYGARVIVDQGDLANLPYADDFADLIVSETMLLTGQPCGDAGEMLRMLKPYGGKVCLGNGGATPSLKDSSELRQWFASTELPGVPEPLGDWVVVAHGSLEGAADWTHEYGDAANTACSGDRLVQNPLGVLWFGEPGPEKMVERHARAAAPVAMDGRMFIQGEHLLMAYDAFNGLKLWERKIPGAVRVRVDSDMSNLVLAKDGLYVAAHDRCYKLDPATGETLHTFDLPRAKDDAPGRWGYLAHVDGLLFGTIAKPLTQDYGQKWSDLVDEDGNWQTDGADGRLASYLAAYPEPDDRAYRTSQQSGLMWRYMSPWPAWGSVATPQGAVTENIMGGDVLFALDPQNGALRWSHQGGLVAHPAIAIADGMVLFAECSVSPEERAAAMQERSELIANGVWEGDKVEPAEAEHDVRRVIALNTQTGEKKWERVVDLTGCGGDRMGAAYRDGILLFFGCFSNHDRHLFRDGKLVWRRITALSAKDGSDLWSRPLNYLRRPVVMEDKILIEPRACDLRTGEVTTRLHPLTDLEATWEFVRPGHCCSITTASADMFFLRGYFMWYYDMTHDVGMLPFGGIRPGCWINILPACGLVLFPEASSGCTCSYPVRSTVVMKTREENRTWSIFIQHGDMTPVTHMAVNFGAPGDWRDQDGTLWFGYPHHQGNSFFDYSVDFQLGEEIQDGGGFYCHGFRGPAFANVDQPWLFASGCRGLQRCVVPLVGEGEPAATYTLRLYLSAGENDAPGERVFDVLAQDTVLLANYDVAADTGGTAKTVVKTFEGIRVDRDLTLELRPHGSARPPLLNGIELIREKAMSVAKAM